MMITKLIGVFLTITSSAAIGIYFSTEVKNRLAELIELKKTILFLRGDIKYAMTPLPEAIQSIAKRQEGKLKGFYHHVAENLNLKEGISFREIWEKSVETELTNTSLNKKDKAFLGQLGENLGYLDKEMQLSTIDLYITQLEAEIEEASTTLKEKTHLYNCLGIMFGIFITIVII